MAAAMAWHNADPGLLPGMPAPPVASALSPTHF
jgi:hypothetical protein